MFTTHWRTQPRLSERESRFLELLARQAADLIERMADEHALREREQLLQTADRRKDEFIAMLAHELRNPLVPIRAGIDLLAKVAERPQLLDTLQPMMDRQIRHMVRLIDDLLDVARITSGKIELKREAVSLANVVNGALDANRAAIKNGELQLTVLLPEPDVRLDVDPTRFGQVISNLVQNATKFTPHGGEIVIHASVSHEPSPVLSLTIRDSGIGISKEQLPTIFELFAQAKKSGYVPQSGLGIGLAIARRLVQLHGGNIDAQSEGLNRGSSFTISLPIPNALPNTTLEPPNELNTLAGVRVLIIDDNRDGADATALLIEMLGGVAHAAYDGPSGLADVSKFNPHIVLLDIGMPGMDGYEVCRRLRSLLNEQVRIIAISGWGQEQDKALALQAGFDAHLTKPVSTVALAAKITSLQKLS